ncbi:GNAT family N-acetyltransferase [Bordetella avium]|uniref:GnaT-family acetyltransferase n=1 Tax=Bordetella avium (strain 197N) TaxID=360910 RepID=Q2KWS7_BORA1|nr:GNAT family N-acetyltransferase [Bordetella avium]RIQ48894.1 GNAT family N-acetyltransferase [Bordetella avium]RIQ74871.1 GNAT family N-acetyltransferase [Bordetella avium]CAJ48380.1 GnaT-family acetyltransferase [Bordetella avium 197N]
MRLRAANRADGDRIAELLDQLGYPGAEGFLARRLTQLLDHPDAGIVVAKRGQAVIGFISYHFIPQLGLPQDFCRISYCCVASEARGMGAGALLEAAVHAAARARGCDRIELHCHEDRNAAHGFYERLGYQEAPKYLMKAANKKERGTQR